MQHKCVWLLFSLHLHNSLALTLPELFSDGMVLQASPHSAHIWGKVNGTDGAVFVALECLGGVHSKSMAKMVKNLIFSLSRDSSISSLVGWKGVFCVSESDA